MRKRNFKLAAGFVNQTLQKVTNITGERSIIVPAIAYLPDRSRVFDFDQSASKRAVSDTRRRWLADLSGSMSNTTSYLDQYGVREKKPVPVRESPVTEPVGRPCLKQRSP